MLSIFFFLVSRQHHNWLLNCGRHLWMWLNLDVFMPSDWDLLYVIYPEVSVSYQNSWYIYKGELRLLLTILYRDYECTRVNWLSIQFISKISIFYRSQLSSCESLCSLKSEPFGCRTLHHLQKRRASCLFLLLKDFKL